MTSKVRGISPADEGGGDGGGGDGGQVIPYTGSHLQGYADPFVQVIVYSGSAGGNLAGSPETFEYTDSGTDNESGSGTAGAIDNNTVQADLETGLNLNPTNQQYLYTDFQAFAATHVFGDGSAASQAAMNLMMPGLAQFYNDVMSLSDAEIINTNNSDGDNRTGAQLKQELETTTYAINDSNSQGVNSLYGGHLITDQSATWSLDIIDAQTVASYYSKSGDEGIFFLASHEMGHEGGVAFNNFTSLGANYYNTHNHSYSGYDDPSNPSIQFQINERAANDVGAAIEAKFGRIPPQWPLYGFTPSGGGDQPPGTVKKIPPTVVANHQGDDLTPHASDTSGASPTHAYDASAASSGHDFLSFTDIHSGDGWVIA